MALYSPRGLDLLLDLVRVEDGVVSQHSSPAPPRINGTDLTHVTVVCDNAMASAVGMVWNQSCCC